MTSNSRQRSIVDALPTSHRPPSFHMLFWGLPEITALQSPLSLMSRYIGLNRASIRNPCVAALSHSAMSTAKLLAFRGCMSMEEMPHLGGAMLLYA